MNELYPQQTGERPAIDPFRKTLVLLTGLLGIGISICGISCALKVFNELYAYLTNPDRPMEIYDLWIDRLGVDFATLSFQGQSIDLSTYILFSLFIFVFVILAVISVSIISAGGKLVYWATTDRQAVRDILKLGIKEAAEQYAHEKYALDKKSKDDLGKKLS